MKPIFKYALIFLFIATGKVLQAQNMGSVNAMLSQQQMQWSMQRQMTISMMLNHSDANFKYKFVVIMADSSRKEVNSKILSDEQTHKTYLLYVDKSLPKSDTNRNQKIYPGQTISIERSSPLITDLRAPVKNTVREKIYKGLAKDSCWMFKAMSGSISVYSYLSVETDRTFDERTIVGIQLHDDGPILKYNAENLKQMVGDDIDALESIQNKSYLKAIKKYNHNRQKEAEKAAKK
ncbi:hypothetical protein [Mucilaginibacter sp. FT3.2]|uniref:hypothetical protein n=1 Tax=Mucilaginibacter sp. FT3.2 TaxID=2723090 RepID=UPI0016079140|nr:hypothetical protein [Mucilaginibacter sp. FT3.2]MBB6230202.1 hypothetical protein [Mucilaginibacter sp. FT3.2]